MGCAQIHTLVGSYQAAMGLTAHNRAPEKMNARKRQEKNKQVKEGETGGQGCGELKHPEACMSIAEGCSGGNRDDLPHSRFISLSLSQTVSLGG